MARSQREHKESGNRNRKKREKHKNTKEKKELKEKIKKSYEELEKGRSKKEKEKKKLEECKKDLNKIERERIENARKSAKARYLNEGETNSRYWFALNKSKKPRNVIYALQNKEGKITKSAREMNKIASKYHENLQKKPEMDEERKEKMKEMT